MPSENRPPKNDREKGEDEDVFVVVALDELLSNASQLGLGDWEERDLDVGGVNSEPGDGDDPLDVLVLLVLELLSLILLLNKLVAESVPTAGAVRSRT